MSKQCTGCKKLKSLSEYHKKKDTQDGLRTRCKLCRKTERHTQYIETAPKTLEQTNAYRRKNLDKYRQYTLKWRKQNPGKVNSNRTTYSKAASNRTPKWLTQAQKAEIEQIYILAKELQWLSNPADPLTVDHIIPLRGKNVSGLHVPWNLQILPRSLNISKGNRI